MHYVVASDLNNLRQKKNKCLTSLAIVLGPFYEVVCKR